MQRLERSLAAVSILGFFFTAHLAHADISMTATGRGQQMLAVRASADGIVARVCPAAPCGAESGVAIDSPEEVRPALAKARVSTIDLADGKRLIRVDGPSVGEEAWVTLLAAPLAGKEGDPLLVFNGFVNRKRGEEGESRSSVVIDEIDAKTKSHRIVLAEHRDDVTMCGRATLVAARALDPATLTLKTTSLMSLPVAERDNAPKIVATRLATAPVVPVARLLRAVSASSAVDRKIATATDGDPETAWSEKAPGQGTGEFLAMSSSSDVGIDSLEIRFRPPTGTIDEGAAPKSMFLATSDRLFAITVPDDAWKSPGQGYEVKLPESIRASCVALVLDQAYAPTNAKDPRVTIAEVTAHTSFDATSIDGLVGALAGGGPRASAAAALLSRTGSSGIQAVIASYDKLDERGKDLALGIVDGGSCAEQVPFFTKRFEETISTAGAATKKNAAPMDEEATLVHARDRLRRCPNDAAVAFTRLVLEGSGPAQRVAAEELAMLKPAAAVPALLDALARASDPVRRYLRAALAIAAKSERAVPILRGEVELEKWKTRPEVAQIDLLRAIGPSIGKVSGASAAFDLLAKPDASFRTRYLLLAPAAELARAGDAAAEAFLRASLHASDEHLRARAAEVAGNVPALAKDRVAAVDDPEVRVREAAVVSFIGDATAEPHRGEATPDGLGEALVRRLSTDDFTFVRSGAARAIATLPASEAAFHALVKALADSSSEVRSHAIDALGAHRAIAYAAAVRSRVSDTEEVVEVRARAILALAAMCDAGSVDRWTKLARKSYSPSDEIDRRLGAAGIAALGILHPADIAQRLAPLLVKDSPVAVKEMAKEAISAKGQCGP